ncbi:MAG: hypothetical protein JWP63_1836 [Candidatus Solibacter sp.]|nr:hypothetical protein [Candidatus Solibacter sp.]
MLYPSVLLFVPGWSAWYRDRATITQRNLRQLTTPLHEDTAARAALALHITQLTLTPTQTEMGPISRVDGALNLTADDIVLTMARDGMEPPPPAFSGVFRSLFTISPP